MTPREEAGRPGAGNARPALTTTCKPSERIVHIMAHRNVNPGAAGALSHPADHHPAAAAPAVGATSFLCDSWGAFEGQPALRIDAGAPAGSLAAWCWAEISSLAATARVVGTALKTQPDSLLCDPDSFDAMFLHRLQPLERVLKSLVDRLDREAQAN